jgi:hypothetical protein
MSRLVLQSASIAANSLEQIFTQLGARAFSSQIAPQLSSQLAAQGGVLATSKTPITPAQQESVQLLRRYNLNTPRLRGSAILAKVIKSGSHTVLVDPGYFSLVEVHRSDLASALSYRADGTPIARDPSIIRPGSKSSRFKPGEYVKVRLSDLQTPFGDVQLDPVHVSPEVRDKLVWQELESRMRKGQTVQGRILNRTSTKDGRDIVHGNAVGVAGYVGFVQDGQVPLAALRNIGTLQHFYIRSLDRRFKRIFLTAHKPMKLASIYAPTIAPQS